MKKSQIFRIILSAVYTTIIIKTITIINTIHTYILGVMILNGLDIDNARIIQIFIWIWNYSIMMVLIFIIWRYFAIPEKIKKPGFFKYFKPSYWESLEIDEEIDEH